MNRLGHGKEVRYTTGRTKGRREERSRARVGWRCEDRMGDSLASTRWTKQQGGWRRVVGER